MPRWSDEVEQLRVLEQRRAWLEMSIEQRGDPKGFMKREAAALTWVFECLEQTSLVDAVSEAREIVAKCPPQPPRVKSV